MEDILLSLGFRKTLDVVKSAGFTITKAQRSAWIASKASANSSSWSSRPIITVDIARKRDELISMHELGVEGELIRESYLEMLLAKKLADDCI